MLAGETGAWTENDAQVQANQKRKSASGERGLMHETELSSSSDRDKETGGAPAAATPAPTSATSQNPAYE